MSLIKCPECKMEISSFAESCSHCGKPMNTDGKLVTIQKTNKKWKIVKLLAYFLLFMGAILASQDKDIGWVFLLFSFFAWLAAKMGKWWTND